MLSDKSRSTSEHFFPNDISGCIDEIQANRKMKSKYELLIRKYLFHDEVEDDDSSGFSFFSFVFHFENDLHRSRASLLIN